MAGAVVQHPSNKSAGTTSLVVTVANPSSGNVLLAYANSDTTIPVPTDNGTGGVWTLRTSVVDGNGAYAWTKQVAAGDTTMTTVTFAVSPSDSIVAGVLEISGVAAAAYDVSNAATAQAGGAFTSTASVSNTTTGTSGDFVVHLALMHWAGAGTQSTSPSWTNGFTLLDNQFQGGTGPTEQVLIGTLNQATAAAISTVCSWTGTWSDAQALIISFKLAAAAARIPDVTMGPMR